MIGLDFGESKSARPASVVFSFWGGINMAYALITALIFVFVALIHAWRIYNRWTAQIGPHAISMNVSWVGLVVISVA